MWEVYALPNEEDAFYFEADVRGLGDANYPLLALLSLFFTSDLFGYFFKFSVDPYSFIPSLSIISDLMVFGVLRKL